MEVQEGGSSITAQHVVHQLQVLLATNDSNVRAGADKWLRESFRSSSRAWEISVELLSLNNNDVGALPLVLDRCHIQLFAAQTLLAKIRDDSPRVLVKAGEAGGTTTGGSAFAEQLCIFVRRLCFDPASTASKAVRLCLADCLALLSVYFSWPLSPLLQSVLPPPDLLSTMSLMHFVSSLPRLTSELVNNKTAASLLRINAKLPAKKTPQAQWLRDQAPFLAEITGVVAARLSQQLLLAQTSEVSIETADALSEALEALAALTSVVTRPLILAIPSLLFQQHQQNDQPALYCLCQACERHPASEAMLAKLLATTLELPLNEDYTRAKATLVDPLLQFLCDRLLNKSDAADTNSRLSALSAEEALLERLDSWMPAIGALTLAFPNLVFPRKDPSGAHSSPTTLHRLICTALTAHPLTQDKATQLWLDLLEHREHIATTTSSNGGGTPPPQGTNNDNAIDSANETTSVSFTERDVLKAFAPLTVQSILQHLRSLTCSSGEGGGLGGSEFLDFAMSERVREEYVTSCEDHIVHIYFAYEKLAEKANDDERGAEMLLQGLADTLRESLSVGDGAGAEAAMTLLAALMDCLSDERSEGRAQQLLLFFSGLPFATQAPRCVRQFAGVVAHQTLHMAFDGEVTVALWRSLLDSMMKNFQVNPRACSVAIRSLCEVASAAGGAAQRGKAEEGSGVGAGAGAGVPLFVRDVIPVFSSFVREATTPVTVANASYDTELYAALGSLLSSMGPAGAPLFRECMSETLAALSEQTRGGVVAAGLLGSVFVLLRRFTRCIDPDAWSVAASITSAWRGKTTRDAFVEALLGNDSKWGVPLVRAAGALLELSVMHPTKAGAKPAQDCRSWSKALARIYTPGYTPSSAKHLAIRTLKHLIYCETLAKQRTFWEEIGQIVLRHKARLRTSPLSADISICVLSEAICSVASSDAAIQRDLVLDVIHATSDFGLRYDPSDWGVFLKPLFSCVRSVIVIYMNADLGEERKAALIPLAHQVVAVLCPKALRSPSKDVQADALNTLSEIIEASGDPAFDLGVAGPAIRSAFESPTVYEELVASVYLYSHLWDTRNLSYVARFVENCIKLKGGDVYHATSMRTLEFCWTRVNQSSDGREAEGLLAHVDATTLRKLPTLLCALRGMRLRQLLLVIMRLGRRLSSTASLDSFEAYVVSRNGLAPSAVVDLL